MPLPKRQHSKQRGRKRRTHWKVTLPSLSKCPQCQKSIIPHRVCPFCGYRAGSGGQPTARYRIVISNPMSARSLLWSGASCCTYFTKT